MSFKKRKKEILNALLIFVVIILFAGIIHLLNQKKTFLHEIDNLKSQIYINQQELSAYSDKLKEVGLHRYKDAVFKKKYPLFSKIVSVVFEKSIKYGFDPNLIMSLIQIESNFDPFAVSSIGACGLMQINFTVWKNELQIDYRKIFEIEYNIDMGLKILKHYYKQSRGDLLRTLHLYNNGYLYNNEAYKYKVISTVFY